jgi:alpha-glucosidase
LVSALGGTSANTVRPTRYGFSDGAWPATLAPGASTPWRTFILGERPGDLLERNYLLLDLAPPSALPDISWIKPGKVMRDTALTTSNSKAIIDFAEKGGLQYVSLDTRWYGAENQTGDATTVRAPNLDLPEIIRYGSAKNIGVILYVDRQQIKQQRDILFPLYEKWGVKGVKIGFIDVGPQEETAWVTETVRKAAENHLMLNIHDGYRSMGLTREYPNLLTVEGIRGNEHFPTPEHNCTVPFARYPAGPADYTVCYYDKRIKTTHAHQLAMAVVSFSPLQWIFWYDRPGRYQGEPEVEFFQKVPTVWDDTRVINGEIGKFATIARRSGEDWFIGTVNNSESRALKVPLAFLEDGRNYVAHLYSDDDTVTTKTKVGVKTAPVNSKSVLDVPLGAGGGQAIWISAEPKPSR